LHSGGETQPFTTVIQKAMSTFIPQRNEGIHTKANDDSKI